MSVRARKLFFLGYLLLLFEGLYLPFFLVHAYGWEVLVSLDPWPAEFSWRYLSGPGGWLILGGLLLCGTGIMVMRREVANAELRAVARLHELLRRLQSEAPRRKRPRSGRHSKRRRS